MVKRKVYVAFSINITCPPHLHFPSRLSSVLASPGSLSCWFTVCESPPLLYSWRILSVAGISRVLIYDINFWLLLYFCIPHWISLRLWSIHNSTLALFLVLFLTLLLVSKAQYIFFVEWMIKLRGYIQYKKMSIYPRCNIYHIMTVVVMDRNGWIRDMFWDRVNRFYWWIGCGEEGRWINQSLRSMVVAWVEVRETVGRTGSFASVAGTPASLPSSSLR